MFAFKNRRNGKYIAGTDFWTNPHRQILTDEWRVPKLFSEYEVDFEMKHRGINLNTYKPVRVKLVEIAEVEVVKDDE